MKKINTAEGMEEFLDFLGALDYPDRPLDVSSLWKAWVAEGFADEESDEGEFCKGFRLYMEARRASS